MMRVLLQQKNSGLYLKREGDWTGNPNEADDFRSSAQAIDYCVRNRLAGLQLVLKFPEQHLDIVLRLATARGRRRTV